ncbi:hypothetical protein ACWEJ6_52730 [Nonomuraea sp. NPDC004702]
MQIAKSAALLGTALGIVVLGADTAGATTWPDGSGDGSTQVNTCNSASESDIDPYFSDIMGRPTVTCINIDRSPSGKKQGGNTQVNTCSAQSATVTSNYLFMPMMHPSVVCINIRH